MPHIQVTITDDHGIFTHAETVILEHLCMGKMRKEIARDLDNALSTVSRHIEHIAEKLDAHSHAEIVAKAVANGLVRITLNMILVCLLVNACGMPTHDQTQPPRGQQQPARIIRISRRID